MQGILISSIALLVLTVHAEDLEGLTNAKNELLESSSHADQKSLGSSEAVSATGSIANSEDERKCHPQCSWKCDTPVCNQICDPVCEAPKCSTSCSELPCSRCEVKCSQPVCEVRVSKCERPTSIFVEVLSAARTFYTSAL